MNLFFEEPGAKKLYIEMDGVLYQESCLKMTTVGETSLKVYECSSIQYIF